MKSVLVCNVTTIVLCSVSVWKDKKGVIDVVVQCYLSGISPCPAIPAKVDQSVVRHCHSVIRGSVRENLQGCRDHRDSYGLSITLRTMHSYLPTHLPTHHACLYMCATVCI